jgi:hypothetical protein
LLLFGLFEGFGHNTTTSDDDPQEDDALHGFADHQPSPSARSTIATCARLIAALLILALCSGAVIAEGDLTGQDRGRPPKLDPAPKNPQAMRFEWVREGPAEKCGSNCNEWASAHGVITPDTASDFEAFARTRDISGKVLVLESNGGAMRAGLVLGRALRRLNMTVAVGRTVMLPADKSGEQRATYSPRAVCASMCPFVLLGGSRRYVPPEARILVHQIWPGAARADSTAAIYSAQNVAGLLRATSEMARYTVDMGGEIELFDLSMRIPPWENLRILTRAEILRTRLSIVDAPFAPPDADATSPPPPGVLPPTGGKLASIARWTLVGAGAERGIVRRHPLTRQGEEIGSFLVTIACADRPATLRLRYWETRTLAGTDDVITRAVMALGRERLPLKIESSKAVAGRLESIASATVDMGVAAKQLVAAPGSVTIATLTKSKVQTSIRIGNTGLGKVLPQLSTECPR